MTQRTGLRPVLHFHNGVAAGLFIPVIGRLPFPAVATFHGILPIDNEALHRVSWRLPLHRILVRRSLAAGVVCAAVSNATAEHIRRRYRLPNGALSVVPNGVSQPEVAPPAFARRAKCSIGFVGEIGVHKNWYAAYEAIRLLRSSGHSVEIIFVGDGPDAPKLREIAASNQGVQYLGPRPTAKSDVIPHVDFLLLPSRSEGMPLVVLEALASGVPVIATAVGGIPEIVRDGIEGVILPGPDKESVRDGILRALSLNRAALAENCRYRYSANFTSLHMAQRYDLLYRKAIETFDRAAGNPRHACT
jgi:glycosyltransferase involved in cell wall biosynthesis